ncbi:hypothetical protein [Microbacterium halotolerans]|uniref:hypothetical protein n=1 Tax=Microbacterium halotolerans TaxID=246613 RepID=UPI0013C2EF0C|nr:hypothetical protein [Microbacterium halotolerans]
MSRWLSKALLLLGFIAIFGAAAWAVYEGYRSDAAGDEGNLLSQMLLAAVGGFSGVAGLVGALKNRREAR